MMSSNQMRGLAAAAALGWLALVSPQAWGESEETVPPETAASETNLRSTANAFEAARQLPAAQSLAALEELVPPVDYLLERKGKEDDEAAIRFLAGELSFSLGNAEEAYEHYREAAKKYRKSEFGDDAEFAAVLALEAMGRDEAAAEAWTEWEKDHPNSPLLSEARIARAWNALRRQNTTEALRLLGQITESYPWLNGDPRVVHAKALSRYLMGEPGAALVELQGADDGAGVLYLRALCHLELGSLLKAAAYFQEIAERYPQSSLRDYALFAKANTFLAAQDYRSAGEEFDRVVELVETPALRAEADLRGAACRYLAKQPDEALPLLGTVVERYNGTDVAARAQFLIGDLHYKQGNFEQAIVELNRVLTSYFEHSVAASAQYRVARSLAALDRTVDATSAFQTVVSGYPLEPEAPAAAYLAGVGLMRLGRPLDAAPYFQLVLDRYASQNDSLGQVVFARPEHREIVEAALCLLEFSYYTAGDLGQLSGAPHILLRKMPPSTSEWRAYALLIDADASAAQGRYDEAKQTLESLVRDFPDPDVGAPATKLLAWTYAQQGMDSLAIATEEELVARYSGAENQELLSTALLDIAHVRFNQKRYAEAAEAYEQFLQRYGQHPRSLLALYQSGLCYLRLDQAGDAVDRWEQLLRRDPAAPISEKTWLRTGDIYFQAEQYDEAKRCYLGLLENFSSSSSEALAMLRMAQCDYNAGRDAEALEHFASVINQYPGTVWSTEAERGQESALFRLGQSAEGTEVLARLVEQYPTSAFAADAQFQIAWQAYEAEQYDVAAGSFRRVVTQFPGYSAADRAHFLMADSYAQMNAMGEAKLAYQQFLSYFPNSELRSTVEFRLGLAQFGDKEFLPAALSFTRVLEDTASVEIASAARYNLALCQRKMGRPAEAQAAFEEYRRLYPNDERAAEISYQLGDIYSAGGKTEEAMAEFERALASGASPTLTIEISYRLGRSQEQMGNLTAALRAYERAMAAGPKDDPFRLSAVARSAALYESERKFDQALAAYRDIVEHANDPELVSLASNRASELEAANRAR